MEQYGIPPPPASVGSENRSLPTVGKKQVVACFLGPELTYGVVKFSEAHVRLFLAEDGAPPTSNSPAGGLVAKTSAVAKHKWREDLEFAIAEAIEYVTAEDDEDEHPDEKVESRIDDRRTISKNGLIESAMVETRQVLHGSKDDKSHLKSGEEAIVGPISGAVLPSPHVSTSHCIDAADRFHSLIPLSTGREGHVAGPPVPS